jgi:hypothetical protein
MRVDPADTDEIKTHLAGRYLSFRPSSAWPSTSLPDERPVYFEEIRTIMENTGSSLDYNARHPYGR